MTCLGASVLAEAMIRTKVRKFTWRRQAPSYIFEGFWKLRIFAADFLEQKIAHVETFSGCPGKSSLG